MRRVSPHMLAYSGFTPLDTRSRRITKSQSQVHEGRRRQALRDQPPASERASTRADDSTPVDELLELAEDATAASSVELATECILSSSLDVHCDRLRRNCPASLYDCRMRFARDVLRQRLRTWCNYKTCQQSPHQYTGPDVACRGRRNDCDIGRTQCDHCRNCTHSRCSNGAETKQHKCNDCSDGCGNDHAAYDVY